MAYEDRNRRVYDDEWHSIRELEDGIAYRMGSVKTKCGIVSVYSQDGWTDLEFIHREQLFIRTFKRSFTRRGLITKAKRFANDVVNEK